jgi:hypothetical protein
MIPARPPAHRNQRSNPYTRAVVPQALVDE